MSDKKSKLDDIFKKDQEAYSSSTEDNFQILKEKTRILEEDRVNTQFDDFLERKRVNDLVSNIDIGKSSESLLKKVRANNKQYMDGLKQSKVFINNDFRHLVPYHPRTLTLIAANTGEGKSTCAANLAYHSLMQGQSVLVISNEENANDFYNRVTSIIKLWNYQNHQDFTEEQIAVFDEYIGILNKKMTVIDNNHQNELGQTTTIEGFKAILDKLILMAKKGDIYDTIIIDYYQNIDHSTRNPRLETWQIQEKVAKLLDNFKNIYPAPIVILAQKKPSKGDNETGFKDLIEGRKIILNVCTCAIELKADRSNFKTDWIIRKSRFSAGNGVTISTGYRFGRYIYYDQKFKEEVEEKKMQAEINNRLGKNDILKNAVDR